MEVWDMDSDDLVIDREEADRAGDVEMNKIQEQRRVVIPDTFLATVGMDVGDKVIIKCTEDEVIIKSAEDVV
jgi:hypothetical protein